MSHEFNVVVIDPINLMMNNEVDVVSRMKFGTGNPEAVKRYLYEILGEEEHYGFESSTGIIQCFVGGLESSNLLLNKIRETPIKLDGIDKDVKAYEEGLNSIIDRIKSGNLEGISVGTHTPKPEEVEGLKEKLEEGELTSSGLNVVMKDLSSVDLDIEDPVKKVLDAFEEGKKKSRKNLEKWYQGDAMLNKTHNDFISAISEGIKRIDEGKFLGISIL